MKKLLTALVYVVVGIVPSALNAADVPPIHQLKSRFVDNCVARGLERTGNVVKTRNFCNCTVETIAKELSVEAFTALEQAPLDRASLRLIPAFSRLKFKLAACMKE